MDTTTQLNRRAFLSRTLPLPTAVKKPNLAGLEPFSPSPDQPWDLMRAAHLLRRAGFGAPREQVDALLNMSPTEAVDLLVDEAIAMAVPTPPDWATVPPPPFEAPQEEKDAFNEQNQANKLAYRAQWMRDMPANGLRDKMALLWSNHFVTQQSGYGLGPYMVQYLTLLRTHALGNFKTFAHEVGTLPAMLLYLNGQQNQKNGPNENYARELCELFTMGITDAGGRPNYTQEEITEIARALTGFRVDRSTVSSYFEPNRFDTGDKTFFGRTGDFGYDDVIDIIFEERAQSTAYRVCTKLYKQFVFDEPDAAIIDELATQFIAGGFEIAPIVRTLLKSAHFFDDSVIGAKIKSPIEYLQCLVSEMGMVLPDDALITMYRYGRNLSQSLFEPPNVAGWPGNHAWLSTGTMPLRWNYAINMINGNAAFEDLDPLPVAKQMSAPSDPYALSRELVDAFLTQPLAEEEYETLVEVMLDGTPDYEWDIEEMATPVRLRGFFAYLAQLPEYQLM